MDLNVGQSGAAHLVSIKDANGNDAQIDGLLQWSTSDATLIALVPSADGKSVVVNRLGPSGTCKIYAQGDADLTAGVNLIASNSLTVNCLAPVIGPATSITIAEG